MMLSSPLVHSPGVPEDSKIFFSRFGPLAVDRNFQGYRCERLKKTADLFMEKHCLQRTNHPNVVKMLGWPLGKMPKQGSSLEALSILQARAESRQH